MSINGYGFEYMVKCTCLAFITSTIVTMLIGKYITDIDTAINGSIVSALVLVACGIYDWFCMKKRENEYEEEEEE